MFSINKYVVGLFLVCVLLSTYVGCNFGTDDIQAVPVKSYSVHSAMFANEWGQDSASWQKLRQDLGPFYKILVEDVLRVGPDDAFQTYLDMEEFVDDAYQSELYQAVDSVFPNTQLAALDLEFGKAFARWSDINPSAVLPDLYYFQGGFNFGVLSKDSVLGIGLEWWLGSDNDLYKALAFPKYRIGKMIPEHVVPNAMKDLVSASLKNNPSGENLLRHLVYYGKVMYLVEQTLPETSKAALMNLSEEQLQWLVANEENIWLDLAKQDVLYTNKSFEIQKWFIDGPNTGPLPNDSPPMAGIWMGWQIVKDYMKRKESVSPMQLLDTDADLIITQYKPGN